MGCAVAVAPRLKVHSSLPVRESNARKRLSLNDPKNTRPPAVAVGPAKPPERPVLRLPSGRPSVTPTVVCHAISPVLAFTAFKRLQGGFWHGRFPNPWPAEAVKVKNGPGPSTLARV